MTARIEPLSSSKKRLPLVERHRPQTLADIVGQDNVVAVLRGFVQRRNMPNLMLSGDSGVGKTSSAFAFIRDFYAEFGITRWQSMVLSINASQENGIETIRNQVMPFATTGYQSMPDIAAQIESFAAQSVAAATVAVVPKIIVLDEADAMTKVAQWALGPIIDQTSENARYIFIVNYQRKMQDDLQSRCKVLRFPPLSRHAVNELIGSVCRREQIAFEPAAAAAIGVVAQSDMRMGLNILSSCVLQRKADDRMPLTKAFVYAAAGRVEPEQTLCLVHDLFLRSLTLRDTCARLESHIEKNNLSLSQVLCDLHEMCLALAAENAELDQRLSCDDRLRRCFANPQFAMAVFEQIDETEQHLLAITDAARMMVQTRAFAAAIWSVATRYCCNSSAAAATTSINGHDDYNAITRAAGGGGGNVCASGAAGRAKK